MKLSSDAEQTPVLPRRYVDGWPELFAAHSGAMAEQLRQDLDFASANDAIVVEGPWQHVAASPVAYVGIAENGQRIRLDALAAAWRFSPLSTVMFGGGGFGSVVQRPGIGVPYVCRVPLGPSLPGMIVGKATGYLPLSSHGILDGKDYYFSGEGPYWSLSVGGDLYSKPDWYYEEVLAGVDEASRMEPQQAYLLIYRAAELYRAGTPSMPFDGPASVSIDMPNKAEQMD